MTVPLVLSVALAADAYRSIADLSGLTVAGRGFSLVEGFIQANTFGLVVRFGDESTPATAAGGLVLAAGAAIGVGPVASPAAAWPLNRIWVRNQTAGSNATVAAVGRLE